MTHLHTLPTVTHSLHHTILSHLDKHIDRQQKIVNNINNLSKLTFDDMCILIQQINQQNQAQVKSNRIEQIKDHKNGRVDNLMSVPAKNIFNPTRLRRFSIDQKNTRPVRGPRKRAQTRAKISEQPFDWAMARSITAVTPIMFNLDEPQAQKHFDVIPLQIPVQQQDRQIQIFRLGKLQDWQQAKKQKQNLAKKKKLIIDLTGQRVMYDYDCRVTKLDSPKDRPTISVKQIMTKTNNDQYDYKRNAKIVQAINRTKHCHKRDKINITKLGQQQIKVKRKKKQKDIMQQTIQSFNPHVKVNLDSHKDIMNALKVDQTGIKVTMHRRQYSLEEETPRKIASITKRLTRSEYKQLKMDQAAKLELIRRKSNLKNKDNQNKEEKEKKQNQQKKQQEQRKRKVSFNLSRPRKQSLTGNSRISVYDQRGRTYLLQRVKQKPQHISPLPSAPPLSPKKQKLTSIDRYNLMYVRFNGNPPSPTHQNQNYKTLQTTKESELDMENVARELRLQSVVTQKNQKIGYSGRKNNWNRDNRIVTKR